MGLHLHASLVLVPNEFFFRVQEKLQKRKKEKRKEKEEYTANSLFIKGLDIQMCVAMWPTLNYLLKPLFIINELSLDVFFV